MLGDHDTITAVATAKGQAALSVVRISGCMTSEIVARCFQSKTFNSEDSHRVYYGLWKSSKGELLDEVLLLYYAAGKGFTGESAAEIICHGGSVVTELVLNSILDSGARLARPGEFTYRAVLNGKMDLAQAENVLELIHAKTATRAAQALKNIKGGFSSTVRKLDEELIYILAHLEAAIDFTTEDIQPVDYKEILERTKNISSNFSKALEYYEINKNSQEGVAVVIAGLPNAGKSSLLNALTGKERSIVSATPGTTRDVIEVEANIAGVKIKLIDTAGMRETQEEVEKIGVSKAREEIKSADIIIYVVDSSEGLSHEDKENICKLEKEKTIICFNKEDLLEKRKFSTDEMDLSKYSVVRLSCKNMMGLLELKSLLEKKLEKANDSETEIFISSQRQKELFIECKKHIDAGVDLLEKNESPELIVFEFKAALLKLKEVLGEEFKDDIMDKVFKEFCIGK